MAYSLRKESNLCSEHFQESEFNFRKKKKKIDLPLSQPTVTVDTLWNGLQIGTLWNGLQIGTV